MVIKLLYYNITNIAFPDWGIPCTFHSFVNFYSDSAHLELIAPQLAVSVLASVVLWHEWMNKYINDNHRAADIPHQTAQCIDVQSEKVYFHSFVQTRLYLNTGHLEHQHLVGMSGPSPPSQYTLCFWEWPCESSNLDHKSREDTSGSELPPGSGRRWIAEIHVCMRVYLWGIIQDVASGRLLHESRGSRFESVARCRGYRLGFLGVIVAWISYDCLDITWRGIYLMA